MDTIAALRIPAEGIDSAVLCATLAALKGTNAFLPRTNRDPNLMVHLQGLDNHAESGKLFG